MSEGVYINQNPNNSYSLRVVGEGDFDEYRINLVSTERVSNVSPLFLEPNDQLTINEFGFTLDSRIITLQDSVDFQLNPQATTLISVTRNGSPEQLIIENPDLSLELVEQAGWILDTNLLPTRPSFTPGVDSGLFVGTQNNSDQLEFRLTSSGGLQRNDLTVIPSSDTATFEPVDIDTGGDGFDIFTSLENGATVNTNTGLGIDGLNANLAGSSLVGFSYLANGSFQPQNINPFGDSLGTPNAFELPV